jgi:arylsulfatase A-like enzyme
VKTAIVILFSVLLVGFSCSSIKEQEQKPNFIFILVDDLGWADLGCYGSTFHETPNIDLLAGEGVRFTNAYAACPVCSPTRASIMTGKYPARTGITDWITGRQSHAGPQPSDKLLPRDFEHEMKLEEVTIAEELKEAGYNTFFAGKWHMGEDSVYWPEHQGFEINKGGWRVGSPRGGYFSPYTNPRLESGPEGECLTDRLTDESIRFLESRGDDPFLLYLSFYTVHTPLQGKPELIEKYERKIDSLDLDRESMVTTDREWIRYAPPGGRFVERVQQGHPIYASMIETLDSNVGRIMRRVKELGLEENTIIFFMSDNGGLSTAEGSPTSNLPLRAGKGWLYEGGIREPMFIKWPVSGGSGITCDVPVTSTDFYPTILEMAGLPADPGQHLDGVSMVSLVKGENMVQRPLFWHYPHYPNQGGKPGAAVRVGEYKLIEFFEGPSLELYNLSKDPGETNDISSEYPEQVEELSGLLHRWQEEVAAEGMDPNPNYDPNYLREKYLKP